MCLRGDYRRDDIALCLWVFGSYPYGYSLGYLCGPMGNRNLSPGEGDLDKT